MSTACRSACSRGGRRRAGSALSDVLDRDGPHDVAARLDPFDVRLARVPPELLRAFNDAGVLSAADVQVARRLAALAAPADPRSSRAGAGGPRAPPRTRLRRSRRDPRDGAADSEEPVALAVLPWPEPGYWIVRWPAGPLAVDPLTPSPGRLAAVPRSVLARGARQRGQPHRAGRAAPVRRRCGARRGRRRLYGESRHARPRAAAETVRDAGELWSRAGRAPGKPPPWR